MEITKASVQAKPKSGVPAYGYRRKTVTRTYRRTRRTYRPTNDRDYVLRYRTITTRDGRRVRQYYRVYR